MHGHRALCFFGCVGCAQSFLLGAQSFRNRVPTTHGRVAGTGAASDALFAGGLLSIRLRSDVCSVCTGPRALNESIPNVELHTRIRHRPDAFRRFVSEDKVVDEDYVSIRYTAVPRKQYSRCFTLLRGGTVVLLITVWKFLWKRTLAVGSEPHGRGRRSARTMCAARC